MAITYPSRVYREIEVADMWNNVVGKDGRPVEEYIPRAKRGHLISHTREPPLYMIALDGDKIVGYAGWIDKGNYNVGGGIRVREDYRGKKVSSVLTDKRQTKMNDKPAIEMVNTQTMDRQVFISKWKRRGWIISPSPEEVPEEIPQDVFLDFKKKAGANFAIFNPSVMAKAWNTLCKFTEEDAELFLEW